MCRHVKEKRWIFHNVNPKTQNKRVRLPHANCLVNVILLQNTVRKNVITEYNHTEVSVWFLFNECNASWSRKSNKYLIGGGTLALFFSSKIVLKKSSTYGWMICFDVMSRARYKSKQAEMFIQVSTRADLPFVIELSLLSSTIDILFRGVFPFVPCKWSSGLIMWYISPFSGSVSCTLMGNHKLWVRDVIILPRAQLLVGRLIDVMCDTN